MDVETTQSADTLYRLVTWLHANRKRLLIGLAAVALVALVSALASWRKSAAESDADAQLLDIPGVVGLAARSAPASPAPLLDLAQQYPHTAGGEYALLLGAEKLFMQGKYTESQQEFSKFLNDHPDSALIPRSE